MPIGFFPDSQGHLTLQSMVRSGNFKPIRDCMVVLELVTGKNEEDPIKTEGASVHNSL